MTLTDILTAHTHDWNYRTFKCSAHGCDWVYDGDPMNNPDGAFAAHAAHVVEEMAAANIVAIELPEADTLGCWEAGTDTVFRDGDEISAVVSSASEAQLVYPTDPAALAAALLAASAAAAVRPTPTPGETP